MKVSLIYPLVSVVERYGTDIGDIGGRQAPLGIMILATYIRQAGHEIQFIDAEAERLEHSEVLSRLKEFQPDSIGISLTTVAFNNSVQLSGLIKKELPDATLIAGGPHVTANKDDILESECFDFAIFGEGELTFRELFEAEFKMDKLPQINGLIYRDANAKAVINAPREYIQDLDTLPVPDRNLLSDIKLYRPPIGCYKEEFVVSLITSRGCPYRCIFCDNNTFGRKIRYNSPEYVVAEIESILTKYKAKELTFVDDTFPSNTKRFKKILETVIEKKLRFRWTCMANLNDLNEEVVPLMRKTGCWQVAVGIESGDNTILKTIRKGLTVERIRERVNLLHRHGIQVKGFFMIGHPGETPETLRKTTEFALELPLTDVTCTIATPIKGTELYEMAKSGKYGPFRDNADTSQFNYWEPVFVPEALTAEELYQAQRKFFKRFYLRPSILRRQVAKISNFTLFKRYIQTAYKIIRARKKTA